MPMTNTILLGKNNYKPQLFMWTKGVNTGFWLLVIIQKNMFIFPGKFPRLSPMISGDFMQNFQFMRFPLIFPPIFFPWKKPINSHEIPTKLIKILPLDVQNSPLIYPSFDLPIYIPHYEII